MHWPEKRTNRKTKVDLQGSPAGKHDILSHSLLRTSVPSIKQENLWLKTANVPLILKFSHYKSFIMHLIVDGPVPRFWIHLIVFGFQATVTLKRHIYLISKNCFWSNVFFKRRWGFSMFLTLIITMWDSSKISRKWGFSTDRLMLGTVKTFRMKSKMMSKMFDIETYPQTYMKRSN